jgi:hypothetical protein
METSTLPVKGCKVLAYARRSGPLSREESLSCHTYWWHGASVFWVSSEGPPPPLQSPLTTCMGMQKTYSNPDPNGAILLDWRYMHFLIHFFVPIYIVFFLKDFRCTIMWLCRVQAFFSTQFICHQCFSSFFFIFSLNFLHILLQKIINENQIERSVPLNNQCNRYEIRNGYTIKIAKMCWLGENEV